MRRVSVRWSRKSSVLKPGLYQHYKGGQYELIDIVRHVADTLAAFGEKLSAGAVIITGAIVPPFPVEPGEEIFFQLEPVGTVSVRFA